LARVAVISDTHLPRGTRALPKRCVELCCEADLLLHCGDVVSLPVWKELGRLGPPLAGVVGNMDDAALRELLPHQRVVEVAGARIGMLHIPGPTAGRETRLAARFPGCGAVVYGHTHVPQVERTGDVWILNPGSPTERRRAPTHAMLVLEVEAAEIRPELVRL
jgi:putative phosphoesterase